MSKTPLARDKKGEYWFVDSRRLIEEEGFNRREDYGDVQQLAREIKAQGLDSLPPLTCFKRGENYVVLRGHRRLRALRILEKDGEILMVRILLERKGYSKEKRLLDQVTENEGKPFTPWEQAKVFRDLRNLGWSAQDIGERSKRSIVYVRRLLSLADAPQKLINLVRQGRVKATFAMDMIAEGRVDELIEKAEKNQLPANPEGEQELFPPEVSPHPPRITRAALRPNSVKIFKKWIPQADEKKMSPEKAKFFVWLKQMLEGELTEEDFNKFFK